MAVREVPPTPSPTKCLLASFATFAKFPPAAFRASGLRVVEILLVQLPTIEAEADRMLATLRRCPFTGLEERSWCKNKRMVSRVKSPSSLALPSKSRAVIIR